MSNQFKPGDLALIVSVSRPEFSRNLGRVVEVIEIDPADQDFDVRISAEGLVCGSRFVPDRFVDNNAWAHHSWLMPLRGDFQPERQKSQEVPA